MMEVDDSKSRSTKRKPPDRIASPRNGLNAEVEVASSDSKKCRVDGKKHVEKGSLTETDLIEAKMRARCSKNREEMTEEERKEERRAANRLSAFQSRNRRKIIIEDLQKTVAQLSKDNNEQRKQNSQMKTQLDAAYRENEVLRRQVAALAGGTHAAGGTIPNNNAGGVETSRCNSGSIVGAQSQQQQALLSPSAQTQLLSGLAEPNIPQQCNTNDILGLLSELASIQQRQQQANLLQSPGGTAAATPAHAGMNGAATGPINNNLVQQVVQLQQLLAQQNQQVKRDNDNNVGQAS